MVNTLNKKAKLYFLSTTSFSDNQLCLIKKLEDHFEITYAVIIPKVKTNYTIKEIENSFEGSSIKTEIFKLNYRFRNPILIVNYLKIISKIQKANPDIIYFANFDNLYLNSILTLLDSSKTVIAFHDVESHSGTPFQNLVNISKKILLRKFKYFQTFSATQSNILKKLVPHKKIYTISLPMVDFGAIQKKKRNINVTNFLFFGNILPYKGLDLLIKAFKKIAKAHPNVRLTIAGRCNDWDDKFFPLIKDCPQIIPIIRFIENTEISKLFSITDYLVLPYRDTTQSGPLMIAYNYNIPVLVSDAKGFEEFTEEGITGFSFKIEVPGDIENKLLECLSRSNEEYESLKKTLSFFTKEKFSVNSISIKYKLMFDEICYH